MQYVIEHPKKYSRVETLEPYGLWALEDDTHLLIVSDSTALATFSVDSS